MKVGNLKDMVKGWFVGNFEPTAFRTNDCEVGIKAYAKGEKMESKSEKRMEMKKGMKKMVMKKMGKKK